MFHGHIEKLNSIKSRWFLRLGGELAIHRFCGLQKHLKSILDGLSQLEDHLKYPTPGVNSPLLKSSRRMSP